MPSVWHSGVEQSRMRQQDKIKGDELEGCMYICIQDQYMLHSHPKADVRSSGMCTYITTAKLNNISWKGSE